jgi:transposase
MVSIGVADPDLRRCPNCERVEKELASLKTQLNAKDKRVHTLEEQVTELQGYVFGRHHKSQDPPKKPGAKADHPGWFRPKPTEVDHTENVSLDACPNCGSKDLSVCAEIEEHTQEDIVLPEPQVTLYRKQVYWCRGCGKKVRGKGKDELPGSPIGPVTKSVADFFRYKVKVTQRDIVRVFKGLFHLSVTEGAVQGFHTQTRKKAAPLHDQIKTRIKTEPAVHADETGAPINGDNGWTWLAASLRMALYVTGQSRGGKVIQSILGEDFEGILSSDFYAGYNKSIRAKAKQKCLVHLDRDLKKLLMNFPAHDPVFRWAQRVRNFFQEARALYDAYHTGKLTAEQLADAAARFKNELPKLIQLKAEEPDIRRLSKRLLKHQDELLTFLDYPDLVSPDNNYAERLIRACAIFRKITGGFRSQTGTLNHDVLMSLAQTAHLNGKDPLTLFHHILTATPKTLSLDYCLSP